MSWYWPFSWHPGSGRHVDSGGPVPTIQDVSPIYISYWSLARLVTTPNGTQLVLPRNPNRIALHWYTLTAEGVGSVLAPSPIIPTAAAQGYDIASAVGVLRFDSAPLYPVISGEWWLFEQAVANTWMVVEAFQDPPPSQVPTVVPVSLATREVDYASLRSPRVYPPVASSDAPTDYDYDREQQGNTWQPASPLLDIIRSCDQRHDVPPK